MSANFSQPTPNEDPNQNPRVPTSFTAWGYYTKPLFMTASIEEVSSKPMAAPLAAAPAVQIRFTFCKQGTSEATPDFVVNNCILTNDGDRLVWRAQVDNREVLPNNTLRIYRVLNGVVGSATDRVVVDIDASAALLPAPPADTGVVPPPPA